MLRKLLLVFTSFLTTTLLTAQGKINAPSVECLGNVTSMSYTSPSGLTLASATWYFGDGATSTNNTPTHSYSTKGIYTIKIDAVFTNSSTRTDSVKIQLVDIPRPFFFRMPKVDTCLSKNKICYKDTSSPAIAGQTITKRLVVWGDGNFVNSSSPSKGDIICHTYAIPAKYTLKFEITDIYGCKNSVVTTVGILGNIEADALIDSSWFDCNNKQICVQNNSVGANLRGGAYKWFIDTAAVDTNAYFSPKKCKLFNKSRKGTIMLTVVINGCKDTFKTNFGIGVDAAPTFIDLSDTVVCKTASISAEVKKAGWDNFVWTLDGGVMMPKPPHSPIRNLEENTTPGYTIGKHILRAIITRGSCVNTLSRNFEILGPAANPQVFGNLQCFSNRQMFFADTAVRLNSNRYKMKWSFRDPNGDNCTSNRAKGQNLNKNCNYSVDWYTKHQYSGTIDTVGFSIQDTLKGCKDSATIFVDLKKCPPILQKDSIDLCIDDPFLVINPQVPISVTFNGGKKWLKFPVVLDSSYSGYYDVGMVFETKESPWAENFGNDSIKIHKDTMYYYDTVYRKHFLHVNHSKMDTFSLKVYHCKPIRATVYLKNGHFLKGEKIAVNWYDGTYKEIIPRQDTIIDSLSHLYKSGGISTNTRITLTSLAGCNYSQLIDIKEGRVFSAFNSRFECLENKVCFTPFIFDMVKNEYWKGSTPKNTISWVFPDTSASSFKPCLKFKSTGYQHYSILLNDSFGCKDTLRDSIFIQEVKANATYLSKIIYCSELKQFLDSSTYVKTKGDSIKSYAWEFGNGVFSSRIKNPLQVINTALDKITVQHAVETVSGCKDTIVFTINIIGPKPYFTIPDTIGCGSLRALFKNKSKFCKTYDWSFGDAGGSTYQTDSLKDVTFNYTKPGRYFISLTGLDTVYNVISGNTYYCKSTFPDKVFQKDTNRSVLVLPYLKTGIASEDTICLGSSFVLKSLSDTGYQFDYWQMGDSTNYTKSAGSSILHQYKKEGTYQVKLNPGYLNPVIKNQCRDSAQKKVLVLGVKADFDIDQVVIPPLFQFYNKSVPIGSTLKWDFGQPATGASNNSGEQNPQHNYGNDTGHYNVCLIATLPYGCSDTICKTVFNNHLSDFQLFNVFTPGTIDGKNDQYDILIEGEDLYDLQIYNRWGILVFRGDKDGDITNQNNWNGKVMNKGEECPSGTYYYLFRYSLRTSPETVKTYSGVITLIR